MTATFATMPAIVPAPKLAGVIPVAKQSPIPAFPAPAVPLIAAVLAPKAAAPVAGSADKKDRGSWTAAFDGARLDGKNAAVYVPDLKQAAEARSLSERLTKNTAQERALERLRADGIPVTDVEYIVSREVTLDDPDSRRWPRNYWTAPKLVVVFADAESAMKYRASLPLRLDGIPLEVQGPPDA